MERLRKRQIIFFICTAFLIIFYVTPVYRSLGTGSPTPFAHLEGLNFSRVTSSVSLLPNFCQNLECLPNLWGSESKGKYLVYTSACKIVDMDPFDPSVTKFLNKNFKAMKCRKPLVKLDNQTLRIDKNQIKNWKFVNSSCCYREVNRVTQSSTKYNKNADWTVSISTKCSPISSLGTRVDIPFLKVECQNGIDVKTSTDFLTVLLPPSKQSKETKRKAEEWDKRRNEGIEAPPSVLIIGVDSISRLHMKRQLPETLKYLETHDFVEMKGYTKIGENTFPNIMGALGGMAPYHYPCWPNRDSKADDCPFIWKNFSRNGYLTALLEDAPGIAIFNYEKTGFVTAPTDYYLRPLMAASHIEAKRPKTSGRVSCFQGLSPTDYMSSYIKRFLSLNGSQYPYFLLSWFTSIGHDEFNGLQTGDHTFRDLLKEAVESPESGSNNTIILFISDHGYRFGDFRETFLGFYEEALPFFFLKVPKPLQERFPHWYQNLQENSHLLTTPLDLHETLKDILKLANYNTSTSLPGLSLNGTISPDTAYPVRDPQFRDRYSFFEKIPTNRTCESSRIPQSYCMCGVSPENGKTSEKSTHLAHFVLEELNSRILFEEGIKAGLCVRLNFSKVLYGRESGSGDVWNNFGALVQYQDFVVALETVPGMGHFEARVRVFENGTEVLTDSVNRINSYHGQNDCMRNYKLKNFCMCQDVVDKENAKKKKKNKKG